MAWTIPDQGEGDSNLQSVTYQEDLDILVAGISGVDCVLSGCAVTGGTDMTPAVAKGAVLSNGVLFAIAAADVTVTTADGTNPRIDLIVVTSSGALAVRAGTAAASPKPPVRTANDVVLYQVFVPASTTQITQARCIDKRVIRTQGPILIAKTTTPVNNSNDSTELDYFTATIPSGLFLAGRVLRFKCGGTVNNSSGTNRQWEFKILYGGTIIWEGEDTAAIQGTRAWGAEFELFANTNSDQRLVGSIGFADSADPVVGEGPFTVVNLYSTQIYGSAAVDSDAGNRDLVFRIQMLTAHASQGTTMHGATLELL